MRKFHPDRSVGLKAESPSAGANARFGGECLIGAFSYVGSGSVIKDTKIGRYCSIAESVIIGPTDHPTDRFTTHLIAFDNLGPFKQQEDFIKIKKGSKIPNAKATSIGNDVWIGARAIIRRGVTIGDGCIIGAGSFVSKDVAPYQIVGGVPAKVIRQRFSDEIVKRLIETEWWNYDLNNPALTSEAYNDIDIFLDVLEKNKSNFKLKGADYMAIEST